MRRESEKARICRLMRKEFEKQHELLREKGEGARAWGENPQAAQAQ